MNKIQQKAKRNVIKAMIKFSDIPSGMGSDALHRIVNGFFKAYNGGWKPKNTKDIPYFLEEYNAHRKTLKHL